MSRATEAQVEILQALSMSAWWGLPEATKEALRAVLDERAELLKDRERLNKLIAPRLLESYDGYEWKAEAPPKSEAAK